ncbi:MAG TPA: ArsA family ATPase, partial [Dehalococcoidia bacterium]|nr:ArsA family ATPase [Dehalococcoidia bacterium]
MISPGRSTDCSWIEAHMSVRVTYSIGKGGVGKTTCAAALALHCSRTMPTLVVSLDPAHNLGDVLGDRLSDVPKEVSDNLWASEMDMEASIDRYLKHSSDKLRQMYGYVRTINLEGYLDALRLSPGIEEYATIEAMEAILSSAEGRYEIVVFDTPPTGLTLRVLALPRVSVMWGERIGQLRKEILDRRKAISSIQGQRQHAKRE